MVAAARSGRAEPKLARLEGDACVGETGVERLLQLGSAVAGRLQQGDQAQNFWRLQGGTVGADANGEKMQPWGHGAITGDLQLK